MNRTGIARLFRNGRSQAVRLPREFRFEGDCVRVRGVDGGVLLEPMITDAQQWFEELDRLSAGPFMAKGRRDRHQPPTPKRVIFE
ncbi:MAG: antitoxin [Terriglobia bacterium]